MVLEGASVPDRRTHTHKTKNVHINSPQSRRLAVAGEPDPRLKSLELYLSQTQMWAVRCCGFLCFDGEVTDGFSVSCRVGVNLDASSFKAGGVRAKVPPGDVLRKSYSAVSPVLYLQKTLFKIP